MILRSQEEIFIVLAADLIISIRGQVLRFPLARTMLGLLIYRTTEQNPLNLNLAPIILVIPQPRHFNLVDLRFTLEPKIIWKKKTQGLIMSLTKLRKLQKFLSKKPNKNCLSFQQSTIQMKCFRQNITSCIKPPVKMRFLT